MEELSEVEKLKAKRREENAAKRAAAAADETSTEPVEDTPPPPPPPAATEDKGPLAQIACSFRMLIALEDEIVLQRLLQADTALAMFGTGTVSRVA